MKVFRHLDFTPLYFGLFRFPELILIAVTFMAMMAASNVFVLSPIWMVTVLSFEIALITVFRRVDFRTIFFMLVILPFMTARRYGVKVSERGEMNLTMMMLAILIFTGCSTSRGTTVAQPPVDVQPVWERDAAYLNALRDIQSAMAADSVPVEVLPASGAARINFYVAPGSRERYYELRDGSWMNENGDYVSGGSTVTPGRRNQ